SRLRAQQQVAAPQPLAPRARVPGEPPEFGRWQRPWQSTMPAQTRECVLSLSMPLLALPDGVLLVGGVDDPHDPAETDHDSGEDHHQSHTGAAGESNA